LARIAHKFDFGLLRGANQTPNEWAPVESDKCTESDSSFE